MNTSREARVRRHKRLRQRVHGTADRPRLSIYRSLNHIYAQVVDDSTGKTLVSASTQDKDLRETLGSLPKIEQSKRVGELVAERATGQGITAVVFDRGGYRYHGRVRAVADAARGKGLQF
jgi:large subunit ribosomal protein L18